MERLKRKVFEIIEEGVKESHAHIIFEYFIIILIISNVVAIVIESFGYQKEAFRVFELISVVIFSIEYMLRLWTSDLKYNNSNKPKARFRFVLSPMGIIDILSILPTYISIIFPATPDGLAIRILRLSRLFRLMKLNRYLDSFRLVKKVIKQRKYELMVTAFIAFLLLLISSTIMFEIERKAQPDKFPDILSAFWWAIATLTTIGYGDIFPITGLGKFLSAVVSLIGIGLVALPTGIISSGFIDEFRNRDKQENCDEKFTYCPHCGKKLEHE